MAATKKTVELRIHTMPSSGGLIRHTRAQSATLTGLHCSGRAESITAASRPVSPNILSPREPPAPSLPRPLQRRNASGFSVSQCQGKKEQKAMLFLTMHRTTIALQSHYSAR